MTALLVTLPALSRDQVSHPTIIIGADASGKVHNPPQDWPGKAKVWNGKGARYNPANQKLVFETFREDIVGGSRSGAIKAPGVKHYYIAGPDTGSIDPSGTTLLYVASKDGKDAYCIGCEDIRDGNTGAEIYLSQPNTADTPHAPERQPGAVVYANQNKDLAAWHPNGRWIIAGVEMRQHALTHHVGNSEIGMFNNLWAISVDGKVWVQLTHYEKTWHCHDPVAIMPYAAIDKRNCPDSARYASAEQEHPYVAYSGSAQGEPPPASGTMRPTVGNIERAGKVAIVWAERVGLHPKYTWGGVLQLAAAEIVMKNGLPTLVNYRRNLTPTPAHPSGERLWSNPGGNTVIGAGYEPWDFSGDDSEILFASDVFLSRSDSAGHGRKKAQAADSCVHEDWPGARKTSPSTQAFSDVIAWKWRHPASVCDMTGFDRRVYDYRPNAAPGAAKRLGHWEEPAVYFYAGGAEYVVFGSSANLAPAWNPLKHQQTFGLDAWIVRRDRTGAAKRVTFFNADRGARWLAYPTAVDAQAHTIFLTVVPGGKGGANPPGAIYRISAPTGE